VTSNRRFCTFCETETVVSLNRSDLANDSGEVHRGLPVLTNEIQYVIIET